MIGALKTWMAAGLAMVFQLIAARSGTATHVPLPASEELYCIHFDSQGMLWLGTSEGIKSYDGYSVRPQYVSNILRLPQLGSDIRSLTSDTDGHLWAGTSNGLVSIDMATGECRLYRFPKKSQQIIYRLFTATDGTLYVGTDDGFSIYNKVDDTFRHFNYDNSKATYPDGHIAAYEGWGVKDFCETATGDMLIGTWEKGLWHYSPRTATLRAYERLNWMNSAFCLHVDRKGGLWIGTMCTGVQHLDRWDDYLLSSLRHESLTQANIVYDVTDDGQGRLLACYGDTICALTGPDGALWQATRFGGISRTDYSKLKAADAFTTYGKGHIRSIYTQDGRHFYIGLGMKSVAWLDTATDSMLMGCDVPHFGVLPHGGLTTRVTSMVRRHNGDIWAAAGDYGVLISHPDGKSDVRYPSQMDYVRDNVTALYESPRTKTLWIGQRQGVSILTPEGKGRQINIKDETLDMTGYFIVNHISEDHEGRIWIASANGGIVSIEPTADILSDSLRYHHYLKPTINVTACFEDSRHHLWAIGTAGLFRLDRDKDRFENTNTLIHLSAAKVLAINEDRFGKLWIATERALVRYDADTGSTISFTGHDGLPSTAFFPNSTFRHGNRLYFGTAQGMVAFTPAATYNYLSGCSSALVVTDIIVDGTSLTDLDSLNASRIADSQPGHTRCITLPSTVDKLAVEFALLTYSHQEEVEYAYRLDGRDHDWQYTDGRTHCATYQSLPPGTYHLHVRAADSYGYWNDLPYTIQVHVLPPWYATWWAYLLYICTLVCASWLVWRYYRMQQEVKASRRFTALMNSIEPQIPLSASEGATTTSTAADTDIEAPSGAEWQSSGTSAFLTRATRLVRNHLNDADYNRDRMAADMSMSVSSLYTKLREVSGMSIQTFIQNIRLNTATDILRRNPDIRISELAYAVGFNTPKYFSQCFKKEFGLLPREWLEQQSRHASSPED